MAVITSSGTTTTSFCDYLRCWLSILEFATYCIQVRRVHQLETRDRLHQTCFCDWQLVQLIVIAWGNPADLISKYFEVWPGHACGRSHCWVYMWAKHWLGSKHHTNLKGQHCNRECHCSHCWPMIERGRMRSHTLPWSTDRSSPIDSRWDKLIPATEFEVPCPTVVSLQKKQKHLLKNGDDKYLIAGAKFEREAFPTCIKK